MAKKTTAKQNTNNGESKFKGIRNFFTSERTRFITGLVISIVTIYVGLALISFFFTGGADQSKIENIPLSDLVINRGSVENWTGVRGAFLADLLMNRWFGISSFLILFFLGSVGAKLMNLSRVSLLKRFLFSAAMLIWGSLFFAFIFIRGYEDTFIYLGGQHGYYLSEVMMNNIGIPGTVLLLVGLFLIVAIFTSKRTIPFLQNVFSFGWLKNRLKRDKSETTEVPEEDRRENKLHFFAGVSLRQRAYISVCTHILSFLSLSFYKIVPGLFLNTYLRFKTSTNIFGWRLYRVISGEARITVTGVSLNQFRQSLAI